MTFRLARTRGALALVPGEVINQHRYSCHVPHAAGTALTDLTVVGRMGTHYPGQRAAC